MENKVLQENIEQIKHYNSDLANDILMFNIEKSNIQLAQNENQQYNVIYNSTPLHSTVDAIQEAKNIVSNIKDSENSIRIVYGLGLGYLIEEVANKINKGLIILYEPNLDILKFILSIAKIDSIYKNNVLICNTKKQLERYISNNCDEKTVISISFLNSYKSLFFDDIKKTLSQAQLTQGELIANKNTIVAKAPEAFLYTLANTVDIFKSPNISDLENIYKGKVALIVGAGPSLQENIEIIKNNQDKFVIFALNPTLKLLKNNDIEPDFIVDIETFNNEEQFQGINTEKYYFILEAFCHEYVRNLKTRKTFNYISENNFFNYFIKDCMKYNYPLETIGTVSYTALMSAYIMGFDKIILIGQDLAYKNGECYAKGAQYEELECVYNKEKEKFEIKPRNLDNYIKSFMSDNKPLDSATSMAEVRLEFLNSNICTVKGQDGNNLPTQSGYMMFIDYFSQSAEKLLAKKPNLKLINSSTGGAQIDGYENIPLEKIVCELSSIEKINLDNYEGKIDKAHVLPKITSLLEKLQIYQEKIEKFYETNQKLIQELKTKNIYTKNAQKHLKHHIDILNEMMNFKKDQEVGFIVNVDFCLIEKYLENSDLKDIKKTIENTEEINKIYLKRKNYLPLCIKYLDNCKSFILQ